MNPFAAHKPAPQPKIFKGQKLRAMAMSPDLSDGQHWWLEPLGKAKVFESVSVALEAWAEEASPGDIVTIEMREITKEEYESLPSI